MPAMIKWKEKKGKHLTKNTLASGLQH